MRGLLRLAMAGVLGWSVTTTAAGEPLTVCPEEDSPPYSYSFGKREGGFDHDRTGAALNRKRRSCGTSSRWKKTNS